MTVSIQCKDLFPDCDFVAEADNEEKLFLKVAEHAALEHGIMVISDEMKEKIHAKMREEA